MGKREAKTPKTDPAWLIYEKEVHRLLNGLDAGTVEHNVFIKGEISLSSRQIDARVQGKVGAELMTVIVECKQYKKAIGVSVIDSLVGKTLDVGADKAAIYSYSGFTSPALARALGARSPRISAIHLIMPEQDEVSSDGNYEPSSEATEDTSPEMALVWRNTTSSYLNFLQEDRPLYREVHWPEDYEDGEDDDASVREAFEAGLKAGREAYLSPWFKAIQPPSD